MTKQYINELTYEILGAAMEVHKALGPGLLEGVYQKCLAYELNLRGLNFLNENRIPIQYKEVEIDADLKCDLFVEDCIVVELKTVEELKPIFVAQLLTYMSLLQAPKGILINFNSTNLFYNGQKTYVNPLFDLLPD